MATAAITAPLGIVSKIFGGMALRAKQARNENTALNTIVQGFDQAIQQISVAYNNGQISAAQALTEINSIWAWYWKSITPQIQPNRNGCSSGSHCPGTAISNEKTNGVPAGFCSSNEGASCCVGCGPIRLTLERISNVLQKGQGTVIVAPIGGDHYGLQARAAYNLTFSPFSTASSAIDKAAGELNAQMLSGDSWKALAPVESALGFQVDPNTGRGHLTSTTILIILAALGIIVAVKK